MQYDINKQTATNTAPVTQKVKIIVSSIFPQFDATGVHHHGLQKWNMIDAIMINANITATNTLVPFYKFIIHIFTTFNVLKQLIWFFSPQKLQVILNNNCVNLMQF